MYQQQPKGMGNEQPSYYEGGYSQMPFGMQGLGPPIDKAPVCCNCCGCTHHGCAKFWVIYNAIQVVLCYVILITEAFLGPAANENSNSTKTDFQKNLESLSSSGSENTSSSNEHLACVLETTEDSVKYAKLSILIILLIIYTIGSVLFSVAVIMKNMDVTKRALYLMIYTATIACFPLAYVVPFLIDLSICAAVALVILVIFWWWYLSIFITTGLAFNIAIVYRKWIMKPEMAVMPQSQQQVISHQSIGIFNENLGKENDSDSE